MNDADRAANRDVIGQVAFHRDEWESQMTNTMTKDLLDAYERDLNMARVWASERPTLDRDNPRTRMAQARFRAIYVKRVREAGDRFVEAMAKVDPTA
jgi:hypothetical protein